MAGVVLDNRVGVLHGVGLLVGTAASVTEADASANERNRQGLVGTGHLAFLLGQAALGGMSDPSSSADDPVPFGHPLYDRLPRQALGEMPTETWTAWRGRYLAEAEAELRVQALFDRAETTLRASGAPVTIRTLWMALADQAGRSDSTDLRAATALAGMARGLRPS